MQITKKQAQTDAAAQHYHQHIKSKKSQRAGQLWGIIEMLKSTNSPPYHRNFSISSLQQLAFAISHTIQRYHRSKKRNILVVHSSVGYMRPARASSKITAASLRILGTGDQGFPWIAQALLSRGYLFKRFFSLIERRLPFESWKPLFPIYLRAFEALLHPRTEKNVISLNLVPSKRKATKKFNMKVSKKSQKKAPKMRQAAHLFVVRWADFSGKWCNCATFHHLTNYNPATLYTQAFNDLFRKICERVLTTISSS